MRVSIGVRMLLIPALLGALTAGTTDGLDHKKTERKGPVAESGPVEEGDEMRIIFLHHSTGGCIWEGGVSEWFQEYNREHRTSYTVEEQTFPRNRGNFPHDYWDLWVNHAGDEPFQGEPTLEILTRNYDVIIWKHCFPVSLIREDTGDPGVDSEEKRLENYRLQYRALKEKMRQFPGKVFIVWTGAAIVENTSLIARIISFIKGGSEWEGYAKRAQEFFRWVREEWDEPGDNIHLWDFYELETEGGLYLKPEYAARRNDSHPHHRFSATVAPLFCRRIVDVVEGRGDSTSLTGESLHP